MKHKKHGRPVDMEQRLENAYDAGYFDGYHEGANAVHDVWENICRHTKGVGPVVQARLMETARMLAREAQEAKNGPPASPEARELIQREGEGKGCFTNK